MEEIKNVHPNKKTRLIFFLKKFVCKEQKKEKKTWIWPGPALVASAAAPPAAEEVTAAVGERAATPLAEPRCLRAASVDPRPP